MIMKKTITGRLGRRVLPSGSTLTVAALLLFGAVPLAFGPGPAAAQSATDTETAMDPRAGDPTFERSQRLFGAVRGVLDEAARRRLESRTDPESPLEEFLYRQLGVDQSGRIEELLGSAFETLTDAPVVDIQRDIAKRKEEIETMRRAIGELKERRIAAPESAGISGWVGLSEDQGDIDDAIRNLEERIVGQQRAIDAGKEEFAQAMRDVGAELSPEQIDLLLESVTGAELVKLAAAYEAVRGVSEQLRRLMDENGEDLTYAKRYYGMHTALIALVLEAQGSVLDQSTATICRNFAPSNAMSTPRRPRPAASCATTRRAPSAGFSKPTARARRSPAKPLNAYREILRRQRADIAEAHRRTEKELRVADNTLRTVDASFSEETDGKRRRQLQCARVAGNAWLRPDLPERTAAPGVPGADRPP